MTAITPAISGEARLVPPMAFSQNSVVAEIGVQPASAIGVAGDREGLAEEIAGVRIRHHGDIRTHALRVGQRLGEAAREIERGGEIRRHRGRLIGRLRLEQADAAARARIERIVVEGEAEGSWSVATPEVVTELRAIHRRVVQERTIGAPAVFGLVAR